MDPQGIAWEQFHTLRDIPTFSQTQESTGAKAGCCSATPQEKAVSSIPVKAASCC